MLLIETNQLQEMLSEWRKWSKLRGECLFNKKQEYLFIEENKVNYSGYCLQTRGMPIIVHTNILKIWAFVNFFILNCIKLISA